MKLTNERTRKLLAAFEAVTTLSLKKFCDKHAISRQGIYAIKKGNYAMQAAMAKTIAKEVLEQGNAREEEIQEQIKGLYEKLHEIKLAKKEAEDVDTLTGI